MAPDYRDAFSLGVPRISPTHKQKCYTGTRLTAIAATAATVRVEPNAPSENRTRAPQLRVAHVNGNRPLRQSHTNALTSQTFSSVGNLGTAIRAHGNLRGPSKPLEHSEEVDVPGGYKRSCAAHEI